MNTSQPTEATHITIKNLDFYTDESLDYLRTAQTWRCAWKIAADGKAPHKVRRQLRMMMRYYATESVKRVRKVLLREAGLISRA